MQEFIFYVNSIVYFFFFLPSCDGCFLFSSVVLLLFLLEISLSFSDLFLEISL